MTDFPAIAKLGITIIFYVATGLVTALSAVALYILNKHGEKQSLTGMISVIYGLLFLILVSNAFTNLTAIQ